MTKDESLAIMYLMYAGASANTKYISTANDSNATLINVANDILNNTFMVNPLRTTYPKIGSIGLFRLIGLFHRIDFGINYCNSIGIIT